MNETNFIREENKLTVTRAFDAPIDLVWRAWTEPDMLDQWWAPKPWQSRTKSMEFKEGGFRLYAMVGPEGEEHWGRSDYQSIDPQNSFSGEDAFCDSEGNINASMPVSQFTNQFTEGKAQVTVKIISYYQSTDHLEQVIKMGMKEGLTMALDQLENVLSGLN